MPHIHTAPGQHDLTVSAFIIRKDDNEWKVLLHMHRKHKILLQVGGHVELDETPWQAIAHELQEESGYTLDELTILQPRHRISGLHEMSVHPHPVLINTHAITADHNHTDLAYAFVATGEPSGLVSEGESQDLRWFTKSELEKLDETEIYNDIKAVCIFVLDDCQNNWEEVPTSQYAI